MVQLDEISGMTWFTKYTESGLQVDAGNGLPPPVPPPPLTGSRISCRQAFKTIIPVAKASIDIKTYLFFINVALTYISSSRNGIAICSEQISIRHACYVTV